MANVAVTDTILGRIVARTMTGVVDRHRSVPRDELERRAAHVAPALGLRSALAPPPIGVIAEIKRGSPSRGRFPVEVEPAAVATAYRDGGAAAISVLTDGPFFHGSLDDLAVVAVVAHAGPSPVPVLRKDFIVDPYQVVESRAFGADALLLIVAALDDAALISLLALARSLGMDALVEVHDGAEMARAAAAGADLIGINNRDLRTFAVDLATTERLAPLAPEGSIVVGESGIFTRSDVERLERAGASAVLVGEGLIVAADRAAAVRALLGGAGAKSAPAIRAHGDVGVGSPP